MLKQRRTESQLYLAQYSRTLMISSLVRFLCKSLKREEKQVQQLHKFYSQIRSLHWG